MKKIFCPQLPLMIFCVALACHSFAQSKNAMSREEAKKTIFSGKDVADLKWAEEAKSNEVTIRARQDFVKTFRDAKDIKWYRTADGYIASFTNLGCSMRSHYNLKGNWKYDMATYTEDKLPADIRYLVKSTYFDYAITLVNEIKTGDRVIYVVHITDKYSWINLWVSEGNMEVLEQISKSK